jgi:DNA-binding Lrp family transcriptional regulator
MHDLRSEFDQRLLGAVERRVPLARRPYAHIAAELGTDQQRVLDRLAAMRGEGGAIREIAGIFDAAALGYSQALLALRVAESGADAAAGAACGHPGVSHCYKRAGAYNIWLTLATSPKSRLGLDKTAALLSASGGADSYMVLPALKRYKLHVRFGAPYAEDNHACEPPTGGGTAPGWPNLTDDQVRAVRALQTDLPNEPEPFAAVAAKAAISADDLLVFATDFLSAGWMRRYAAVLRHRAAGAAENVLVAWRVETDRANRAGAACAAFRQVSHCYLRPAGRDWPYTLYTMIHGSTADQCRRVIADLAAAAGMGERAELWTLAEYKKKRISLFSDQEAQWEAVHG